MYRNDPILPTFALILAAGLFYAAYLDGRHIARIRRPSCNSCGGPIRE